VFLGGKQVRTTKQIEVSLRVIAGDFLDDVIYPNHCSVESITKATDFHGLTQMKRELC
jgi:hypothetical protein